MALICSAKISPMKKILTLVLGIVSFSQIFSQSITEVYLPQYIQGNTSTNNNRLTYVCRLTLSGLTANATYRYYTAAINSSDGATSNGAGNPVFFPQSGSFYSGNPSLSTAGGYDEFTTNSSGAYTGWFGLQPTGNARFTTGQTINLRIMLNNGSGGTSVATRLSTTSGITVLELGTTSALATGIRSVSCGDAKNFVLLWDNTSGTGRPISGTLIEDDGFSVPTSYASFYRTNVDGAAKAWGTLIPNTLSNGIRRIEQFSLSTGNAVGTAATDADGTWPTGSVNTVNPTGGTTAIVIDNADAPLATCPSVPVVSISPTPGPLNGFCAISPNAGEKGFIRVSGSNLTGAAVTLSATSDFEISLDGTTFSSSVSPSYSAPTLNLTDVFVRLKAGLSTGSKTGTLTLSGGGASSSATLTLNGTVGGATSLGVSDIVFTGLKTTTPGDDQFAFLATVDIAAGTDILFTDRGWDKNLNVPAFNTAEQTLTWNSGASTVAKGTVVRGNFASGVATWNVGSSTGSALDGLSNSGESVIAYQLSSGCPSFIHAVNSVAWLTTSAINTNSSYLPDALNVTNGNVVSGGTGSRDYTGSRSCNTMAAFKNLVNNNSNWSALSGSNLDATNFTEGLSISISVSPTSRLENNNTPVTITATACGSVPSNVTVNLSFAGTATNGSDYSVSSSTITITSGNTTGTASLTNINDFTYEGDETVIISIASVSGGGAVIGSPSSTTYTILEDDDATYYSCASGLTNAAIWSFDPGCATSGTAVFSSNNRFVVQSGHTIELQSSPLSMKSLEIQNGGKFWRNSSNSGNMRYLSVYDYIYNEGTFGNDVASFDAIGINVEGANVTIYGGGTWNFGRIRKNTISPNTNSSLTISDGTFNLYFPGTAIYNDPTNSSLFINITGGTTVNVYEGNVAIDGTNGLSSGESFGGITVDGTLNIDKNNIAGRGKFLGTCNNTTLGTCSLTINNGGIVIVDEFDFNNAVAGANTQFSLSLNGGKLLIREALNLIGGTFTGTDKVGFLSTSAGKCAIIDDFSPGFTGTYNGTGLFQRAYNSSNIFKQLYFSSPVNNASITDFAPAKGTNGVAVTPKVDCDEEQLPGNSNYGNVFEYNESLVNNCYLEAWVVRSSGTAQNGKGYSVVQDGTGQLELVGSPNLAASYTINNLGNKGWSLPTKQNPAPNATVGGWHLLGNPYPSNLDPVNPNASEFGGVFKVLDAASAQYIDKTFASADLLAPFQGFFVYKTNNGGTANFTINGGANRSRTATQFYKGTDPLKQLKIKVVGNGNTDECYLNIIPGASSSFDLAFDGYKWFSSSALPALFTSYNDELFSTNTIGSINENPVVPLNFKVPATDVYQIEISGIENLPNIAKVIIEDKVLNKTYEFANDGDFTFNASKGDAINRFNIRFEEATVSGINEATDKLKLFVSNKTLNVDLGAKNNSGSIEVFNTLGAKVATFNTHSSFAQFDVSTIGTGTFIAKLKSGNSSSTKKFVIAE